MAKKSSKPAKPAAAIASPDGKPVIAFSTTGKLERWLIKHHAEHGGVWIQFFKKDSGHKSITYAEALDVALCYGWIDGPVRKGDEVSWIHKFTPRGKRSVWSQVNKKHIERLIRDDRMKPAGHAAVELAKADGRWDGAYASSSTFKESAEFLAALKKSKKASDFYATLSKSKKYAFYYRLHNAKKPETKARKLVEFIAMLERGETFG
ncbi:bacteriocin-protection protein, YdeI/OmpD-associated family [Roseiconus nitratireducens]|uniref:Bacteriocin-protection protein, YdeI/OmpD-associated family n=1 Tax=Roseiconus nitratireducens TaxID=2605748 RepID=A0A5M6CUC8_9BACT|nr:YdeI/OmpD-associated family protein [Roseiconus nitratireducens]KAA5538663.1 bacteriocin-protection protein, YdeI/OmpD-associated family [Roseiconus nitratireducens]